MNKTLLLEKYIKKAVRMALKEEEQKQKRAEKSMYFIHRFPGLKKVLEELMSPSFGRYVSDITLIAPKPTTFGVGLINGQDFTMMYLGKNNFVVKIAGKKYNPINIGESERASQAIADLLELNYAPKESADELASQRDASIKADLETGENTPPPTALIPGETPTPEEEPTPEETPIPEEEPVV
jgi:hypothetical protein